jgi:hypothetical protein
METVNERLNLIVDTFEKGVKAAFARKASISSQGAQEILAGRKGDPSFKVLAKILESYPAVDANWLVLGQGAMLRAAMPALEGEDAGPKELTSSSPPTATAEVAIMAVYVDSRLKTNPDGFGLEIASKEYQAKVVKAIRTIQQTTGALPVAGDYLEFDESESLEITHRHFQFGLAPADSSSEVRVLYRYREATIS